MTPNKEAGAVSAGTIIGWCVLAAGVTQIPGIVVGILATQLVPRTGWVLLLLTLPSGLLLFLGGLGLIYRQFAGYYCVYVATFFGGIGGFKAPFIPFIKRFVNIGPATEDLFLCLNLVLVAILVWEHWSRLATLPSPRQRLHRLSLISLVVIGVASVSTGRALIHRERGEKQSPSELPVVGASFSEFKTAGPVRYGSVEAQIPRGITLVASGTCDGAAIEALSKAHKLRRIEDPLYQKKFLPQFRAWKLDEATFPAQFSAQDSYYVGRLKDMPKVSLQVVHRQSDNRFSAQVFGVLPK